MLTETNTCNLSEVTTLTEEALLDPTIANAKLAKKKLKIEKIEEKENGEKVVTMKESTNNLICG